jgi:hydrogenase nickel incorporation protein HypA/HybF
MHESSLLKGLMRQISDIARQNESEKVITVKVKLGALSNISLDHFREHFVLASKGTCAEGAELEIEQLSDISDPHAQDILLDSVEIVEL